MTKLLVSVRNSTEADAAVRGGADLIDIKEPRLGSLGAAPPGVMSEVANAVPDCLPVSAALGELHELSCFPQPLPERLVFAKMGLSRCADMRPAERPWLDRWREVWMEAPPGLNRVAVVYVDWQLAGAPRPEDILDAAVEMKCAALLLDTYRKDGGNLFTHVAPATVSAWLRRAQTNQWTTVIAGSLDEHSLPVAIGCGPDFVAVRGAVCQGDRQGSVCEDRVRRLRQQLTRLQPSGPPPRPAVSSFVGE